MIWPPPDVTLTGSIVRLEPIRGDHRDSLLAAAGDPDTWAWIDRRVPDDPEAFGNWFDARIAGRVAATEWPLVTISINSGEPIGSSSYLAPRPEHDSVEIGWTWLHPAAWRTGANREAKLLMLDCAFGELGARRVEFKTDARNGRSRAALLALGAQFEGVHRKHMQMPIVGDRDSAYFSIIDDEWPEIEQRLRAQVGAAGITG